MLPDPTSRIRFREMTPDDLGLMTRLLGDPEVMAYYPRPKTVDEAAAWIEWNQRNCRDHGYGLWIVETPAGELIGDCGLTWQHVGGERFLEVGYHVVPELHGRGYATEAARVCLALATGPIGETHVAAIIHPDNLASRRVAEKLGMSVERQAAVAANGLPAVVYGIRVG